MTFKVFSNRNTNKTAHDVAVGPAAPDAENLDHLGEKQLNHATDSDQVSEKPSEDVQDGLKKVQAVTLTWTNKELYFAYGW